METYIVIASYEMYQKDVQILFWCIIFITNELERMFHTGYLMMMELPYTNTCTLQWCNMNVTTYSSLGTEQFACAN